YARREVTHKLNSGRLPYDATSLTELALKQQQEEPPTLDTLVAAVGPELADAVAIALALDPSARYQTAREMGRALHDGPSGISPAEPATAAGSAAATRATSVLASGRRSTPATRVLAPRQPGPGPPRQQPAAKPARAT